MVQANGDQPRIGVFRRCAAVKQHMRRVWQETAQPPALDGLKIRHDALRDLWPAQINTLNVEGQGDIKTLTFRDNVELLSVEFKGHHH